MKKIIFKVNLLFIICIVTFFFSNISMPLSNSSLKKNKFISYMDIGQGKPLILIHAFPTDQELWKPQQHELANYFRVVTLDLWGFGQSTATNGKAISMTEYADEVEQLMDQLHITRAIIGGESMGGYIALAFLEKYPHKVEGLILSNTQAIADSSETKVKREASAVEVLQNGTSNLINNFLPKALSANAPKQMKVFLQQMLEKQQATAIASSLRGMAIRKDTSDLLAKSTLPILIITSDHDTLISAQESENMNKLAKNSKLITINEAGHLSSLEQAQQWNRAVISMFYN